MAGTDNIIRPPSFQGPTSSDGGDGVSLMKDYVDARDDAVESRLTAKLDRLPSEGKMWGMVASTIGGIFAIAVAVFAVLEFAGDRFNAGMASSPMMEAAAKNQASVDQQQNSRMDAMDKKLDIIINQTSKR